MKKKEKMSPTEAKAYLRGVLDVWGDWSKHHRRLVEAIVILLQEVEGGEAQIEQYRHCNEELFEKNEELKYDLELLKQEKSVVIVEAITEFATRFTMHIGTYTDKGEVKVIDVFRLIAQIAEEMKGAKQ